MPPPSNPPANRRVTRASKPPPPPPPSKDNSLPVQAARPAPRNITTTLRRSRSKSLEDAKPPDSPKRRVIRRLPCVQCVPRIAKGKVVCCEVGPICRPRRLHGGRCETIPKVGDTRRNASELAFQAIEHAQVGISGRMAARYLKTYATSAMRSLNRVRGPATDPLSDYEFDDDDGEEKRWMTTPVVSQQTPVQRTPVVNQKTPVQRDAQQVQEDIQNVVSVAPQEEEEEVQDEARAAPQEKEESEDEEIQDEIRVVQEGEEEDGEQVVVKQEGVEAESDDDMEHQVTPGLEEGQEIGPGTGEEAGPRLDDEVTPGLEEDPAPGPEVGAVVPAATPMEAAVSAISSHSDPGMIAAVDRNTTALNRLAAAQEEHNRLLALQLEPLN